MPWPYDAVEDAPRNRRLASAQGWDALFVEPWWIVIEDARSSPMDLFGPLLLHAASNALSLPFERPPIWGAWVSAYRRAR